MFNKFIFVLIIGLSLITGCTISHSQTQTTSAFEIVRLFPPIYYGTDDFPESAFYVTIKQVSTGKYYEKLYVDQRCENDYLNVNTGDIHVLTIKIEKNIFNQVNIDTSDLRTTLCPDSI